MIKRTVFWGLFLIIAWFAGPASAEWGVPPSVITGLDAVQPASRIELQAPDVQAWLREDADNESKGVPLRIGAERLLADDVTAQAERVIDEEYGLIWRLMIRSPGALELQAHLTDIRVTDQSELYVYGPGDAESEIYTREDIYENHTLWSWGTPGDTIVIEWHYDVAADGTVSEPVTVPFTVKSISHIYKDFEDVYSSREGSCHNDATCDTAFRPERNASAHIQFNDGGTYICSGTMLNSAAQNFVPYFLTANHRVSRDTVANSVKAWFFYHTANCNDPPPDLGYRTVSGASLLATGAAQSGNGTDFSLLQLSNADYTGVFFAGWDRTALGIGDPVTCIHHPDGAYKRISYGTVRSDWYNGQWGVNWDRTSNPGVTEPGSSGSAIFHANTHRVAGQLWAGSSACNNQNGRDFFGRFPLSFQNGNLGQWLGNVTAVDGAYWNSAGPTP
ncbi:MAG TPA: trypsin-like peptidase domain-containing protein, partial [bacterium]|nr:trypsin-like peptidase domain-containing protein [bacterium]